MSRLYGDLALAYHEMYRSLYDYQKEFDYYDTKLRDLECKTILEIGCGTGHLARYLLDAGYDYTGYDLSEDMLDIARTENPDGVFIQGDMREIKLDRTFDTVLITGRTFIHLIEDDDIYRTLDSVRTILEPGGYLIFDCIDSDHLERDFRPEMVHEVDAGIRKYKRESKSTKVPGKGYLWRWDALYRIRENDEERKVEDTMILRAFNRAELAGFLDSCGYEVAEISEEGFDLKAVARRIP